MSGFASCLAEVAAAGGGLSRDDATRMLEQVDARAQRLMREQGLDQATATAQAGRELSALEAQAADVERRNALMNLQKRIARRARLVDVATTIGGKRGVDLVLAVRNQVVAINTVVKGGRASAERMAKTRVAEYLGGIEGELHRAGLLQTFQSTTLRNAWGRELFEMSLRDAGEPSNVGVTGSPQARQIAEVLARYQGLARDRLNRQGAWIGDYAGYITRTAHDPDALRRAGFDAWRAAIEPRLSERTFDGVDDRAGFLQSVYSGLRTGVHLSDEGGVGMRDPAFTGPSNMARSASAERVLHFQDAAGWLDYQNRFGTGTLEEQLLGSLQRSARQEALLSRFGTNPGAEFTDDIQYLEEQFRTSHPDAVVKLRSSSKQLQTLFGYLDGTSTMPANQLAADISAGIRAVSSMAHLGGVAFTHLSAVVTKAAELRYQGVGFLERYGNGISSLFHGLQSNEARHAADLMLAGVETSHGGMMAQVAAGDTAHGVMAKTANKFFNLTGLSYLLRGQKNGAAAVIARHLGSMVDREFDALPAETQRAFTQYDISPADWDSLRQAPEHTQVDGRTFLTPDAASRSVEDLSATERDTLGLKLHSYLADIADRSTIAPGIAERMDLTGGHQAGTPVGEALRFISQFKSWGLAAARQGIGREINGGQGTAGAVSGMMQMAVSGAIMGYTTMVLKDLFKGKQPRPPNDPATWAAALIQGGGFGIMGDYLFGEFNRAGGGIANALLGPVAGEGITAVDAIREHLLAHAEGHDQNGKQLSDLAPELTRLALNNTPFINLFYTRSALNYLLLYSLQERMNPGYLARMQRSMQKNQAQSFMAPSTPGVGWLNPSQHLRTFGR